MLLLKRDKGSQFSHHGAVRTPDGDCRSCGGAHHNTLHHGLPAYIEMFIFLRFIHNRIIRPFAYFNLVKFDITAVIPFASRNFHNGFR